MKRTEDSIQIFLSDLKLEAQVIYLSNLGIMPHEETVGDVELMPIAEIPLASFEPEKVAADIFLRTVRKTIQTSSPSQEGMRWQRNETKDEKALRRQRLVRRYEDLQQKPAFSVESDGTPDWS